MSTPAHFTRSRMIPNPIGIPPLEFNRYTFGQMKPIPFIPLIITLTPAFQSYAQVFVPKNTWGIEKRMIVEFQATINSFLPNQVGGPFYQERYSVAGVGNTLRLAAFNATVVPQSTTVQINRSYVFDGITIFEYNYDGGTTNNSVSNVDGIDHLLAFSHLIGPFDNTIDNTIEFQISTTFAGSTDTVEVRAGQAYIQSPLDLRRLTP